MRILTLLLALLLSACATTPEKPKPDRPRCRPDASLVAYRAVHCAGTKVGDRCFDWTIGVKCT